MKYIIGLAIIGIFGAWSWRYNILSKRHALKLKSLADMGRDEIGGQSVSQWLDVLKRDAGMTLLSRDTGVLNILGHPVLLVDGKVAFTTLGRFGAIGGWTPMLLLVAVDSESISALNAQHREFKRLNGTDDFAVFSIRHLEDVFALCKPIKT